MTLPPLDVKTIIGQKAAGYAFDKATQAAEGLVSGRKDTIKKQRATEDARREEYCQRLVTHDAARNVVNHPAFADSPPRVRKLTPLQEETAAESRARRIDQLAHQTQYLSQQMQAEQTAAKKRLDTAKASAQKYRDSQSSWWPWS